MIATILATLVPSLTGAPAAPALPPLLVFAQDEEVDEVGQKIAAAGDDVAKLTELAAALTEEGDKKAARKVHAKIVELDPDNEASHKALRHHNYDGKWFKSYAELSKYRREEAKRMLEEHGKVRFNDEWVPQEDLPYLRMNWIKLDGEWVSQAKLDREKDVAQKEADGWKQQPDLVWLSPDEQPKHFDEHLWKCGEEWLIGDAVDEYHGEIGQWWTVPGEHFVMYTTNDWEDGTWIRWWADQIYPDLVRAYGIVPEGKPVFFVLKTIAQYNDFAAGNQGAGRPPSEIDGFSSLHYSFFAESNFQATIGADGTPTPEYLGAGVAYWDSEDPAVGPWGQYAVRHAAAHSFAEAIDPSWNAISQIVSNPGAQPSTSGFWGEKQIPKWMRYGVAAYCERYLEANRAGLEGDPWQLRNWAIGDLVSKDDQIDELEMIFAFNLDLNDIEGSGRMIQEAGLLCAFMLDGECGPVAAAHGKFKQTLKAGKGTEEAVTELQTAISENEDALRSWAGLGRRRAPEPETAPAVEAASDTGDMDADGGHGAEGAEGAKDADGEMEGHGDGE